MKQCFLNNHLMVVYPFTCKVIFCFWKIFSAKIINKFTKIFHNLLVNFPCSLSYNPTAPKVPADSLKLCGNWTKTSRETWNLSTLSAILTSTDHASNLLSVWKTFWKMELWFSFHKLSQEFERGTKEETEKTMASSSSCSFQLEQSTYWRGEWWRTGRVQWSICSCVEWGSVGGMQ